MSTFTIKSLPDFLLEIFLFDAEHFVLTCPFSDTPEILKKVSFVFGSLFFD
jgi:hypothetical protein